MSAEQARSLRQQGIAAAKAGQNDQARQLLQQSLRLDPRNEAAWIWLASLARDRRERLICFQKVLEINPGNETALKALQSMGIQPEELLGQQVAPTPKPQPLQQPAAPGVPVPDPQRLAQAQQQADEVLRKYRLADYRIENVRWVRKTRQRAGERDTLYFRLIVAGGLVGVLLVIGLLGTVIVLNNPELRGIVFAPTWTLTPTATVTPTPTPGFTPTPSPTPELTLTPSPTVPPNIPRGDINAPPGPTRIYPEVSSRFIADAVALINRGEQAVALPTLQRERELTSTRFNPQPYYYEALALLKGNEPERALRLLQDAEQRLGDRPEPGFKPLVDLGMAEVFFYFAQTAFANRQPDEGRGYLEQVELRAESAIAGDPRLARPYVLLAEANRLLGNTTAALEVLNRGLESPQLAADVSLIVERGEVYFERGDLDLAAQEAFLALYIDPTAEEAYLLQIKTALAQGDPGLAVIYAQNYLFFYPGSAEGYKLLGDARVAEGNVDLALAAYDQALAAEGQTSATVGALVARAQLAMQQQRYDQARNDLSRAYNFSDDPQIQALRMQAAYLGGSFGVALDDADSLLGSGVLPDSEIQLLKARILIDGGADGAAEALTLLDAAGGSLSTELQPVASEYRARALFFSGQFQQALTAVDAALLAGETGSRRFLRGQILEALDQPEAAVREYEWVVAWSEIYPFPFLPDARSRLAALTEES